jgi:retron-type reverse transcriptase
MALHQASQDADAAEIDQMTEDACERRKDDLLALIHDKIKSGIYHFKPARRVLIPKEGSAKMRNLGIPVVMHRGVSQSIILVFQEIFEPNFSRSNYGFAGVTASARPPITPKRL